MPSSICYSCGGQLAEYAWTCPKCGTVQFDGNRSPRRDRILMAAFLLFTVTLVGLIVFLIWYFDLEPATD